MAIHHLGVPIMVGQHFLVVQDEHYEASKQKLIDGGLTAAVPNRAPHSDIMATLPDPDSVMAMVMEGYASLDRAAAVFDYPEREEQLFLVPNSFACLPLGSNETGVQVESGFDTYVNIQYPLERALVESFIKCCLLEQPPGSSDWGSFLMASVETMLRYLDIENDILGDCTDPRAVDLYSEKFGRKHEVKYGPPDYRISKRIGSGKELPVNSRGRPLAG